MSGIFSAWPSKVLLSLCLLCWTVSTPGQGKEFDVVTNHWHVELTSEGGPALAKRVARDTGFTYVGPVLGSDSEFHFVHHGVGHARSKRSIPHTRLLRVHPHVRTAFQQSGYIRAKRGFKKLEEVLALN
ncbi:hypothetical protein EGW08_010868, partial [Elysia chlorotica]